MSFVDDEANETNSEDEGEIIHLVILFTIICRTSDDSESSDESARGSKSRDSETDEN